MAVFYGENGWFHGENGCFYDVSWCFKLGKVTVFNEEDDDSPAHKHILGWNKEFMTVMTHEILGYQYPVLTPRYTLKLFYFHCQGNYQRGHHEGRPLGPEPFAPRSSRLQRAARKLGWCQSVFPWKLLEMGIKVCQSPFCWHFGSKNFESHKDGGVVQYHVSPWFIIQVPSNPIDHSNGWISWHLPIRAKWNAGLSNIMNSCNPLTSVLWTRTYQFQVAMFCPCLLVSCACLVVWYWSSHKLMWDFKSSERVSCHTGPIGSRNDLIQSVFHVLWVA